MIAFDVYMTFIIADMTLYSRSKVKILIIYRMSCSANSIYSLQCRVFIFGTMLAFGVYMQWLFRVDEMALESKVKVKRAENLSYGRQRELLLHFN